MNWSLRLAPVRSITLKVHITFAFIVLLARSHPGSTPAEA